MGDSLQPAKLAALEFLKRRCGSAHFKMVKAFHSFVTGLRYFKDAPIPRANEVYICKRCLENPEFQDSIKVYEGTQAFGYVPRELAKILAVEMDGDLKNRVVLCVCTKSPTKFSANAIFILFELDNKQNGLE